MNKSEFVKVLQTKINYSEEDCLLINNIFEKYFFLRSKNKDKIITELTLNFNITEEEALNIYETAVNIINAEIKNKLKHPFKSKG